MDEKKFLKVLTKYERPAIILYIDDVGDLKLITSADLTDAQDMLAQAASFVLESTDVEVSDGTSEFVSNINLH